jgi:hypothetical protein
MRLLHRQRVVQVANEKRDIKDGNVEIDKATIEKISRIEIALWIMSEKISRVEILLWLIFVGVYSLFFFIFWVVCC